MISTIHDAIIVNKGRKDRNTNMEIKKPYAVVLHNKFINDVDRADQHLSLLNSEENCKMVEKCGTLSAKLCALQSIFCVQNAKYKVKYKNFLHEVGIWMSIINQHSNVHGFYSIYN